MQNHLSEIFKHQTYEDHM